MGSFMDRRRDRTVRGSVAPARHHRARSASERRMAQPALPATTARVPSHRQRGDGCAQPIAQMRWPNRRPGDPGTYPSRRRLLRGPRPRRQCPRYTVRSARRSARQAPRSSGSRTPAASAQRRSGPPCPRRAAPSFARRHRRAPRAGRQPCLLRRVESVQRRRRGVSLCPRSSIWQSRGLLIPRFRVRIPTRAPYGAFGSRSQQRVRNPERHITSATCRLQAQPPPHLERQRQPALEVGGFPVLCDPPREELLPGLVESQTASLGVS